MIPPPADDQLGKYLATIGVCEACHTPPAVQGLSPEQERAFRTDPDWVRYLDPKMRMAGGVPFIIRLSGDTHGVVYTSNLTPDPETGLGKWTDDEIVTALRTGRRPDGSSLFLFAPHTFFAHLSSHDAKAIVGYLRSLPPVKHAVPARTLPFTPTPVEADGPEVSPQGRTPERADYLLKALVGCGECHSHHDKNNTLLEYVGGNPSDPYIGVFRLGPDLPLRAQERGFAAFPYPGYGVLYGGNLTRFGEGGDWHTVSDAKIARAIRQGISVEPDEYGRERPLSHIMMWQFYSKMSDDDVYSIVDHLRKLKFKENDIGPRLILFGEDWHKAFEQVYGQPASEKDAAAFGK